MLANRFIFARDRLRGLTHMLIMWGCLHRRWRSPFRWSSAGCTSSRSQATRTLSGRRLRLPDRSFPHDSRWRFLIFHGLVWASFLVIAGVMLAMRRRMREEGAAAVQPSREDFMPLILLFAVSLTGLMLTASYTWMKGYAYTFIAILHAITVIGTFLWLPFGKFFHIFQRPAQLGVGFYKDVGRVKNRPAAAAAATPFSSRMHVERSDRGRARSSATVTKRRAGRALPVDLPALPPRVAGHGAGTGVARRGLRWSAAT